MPKQRGNGDASYRERKPGQWEGRIMLGYRPDGKPDRRSVYGQTRAECREKINQLLDEWRKGTLRNGAAGRESTAKYLERWLETVKTTSLKPSTLAAYDLNIRRASRIIGKVPLSKLTVVHLQECYQKLLARGLRKSGQGLSRRSVEQCHVVLHTALAQALRWGLISRNPADLVVVPRPERKELQTLTLAEVQQLLDGTRDHRLHALWVLLSTTALRLGEALGLKWDDIDWNNGRLTIRRIQQCQKGKGLVFTTPKTRLSRRPIYLAPGTVTALREHQDRQHFERRQAAELWTEQGLVFCRPGGSPLPPSAVQHMLPRLAKNLGISTHVHPHLLRHTAATLLLAQGVHPKIVADLLGHSTVKLTLDTYSHAVPALHAEIADHMQVVFERPQTAETG